MLRPPQQTRHIIFHCQSAFQTAVNQKSHVSAGLDEAEGCTCRHTGVFVRAAECPPLSARALVRGVTRLAELRAALLGLHGAQRFICMSETQQEVQSCRTAIARGQIKIKKNPGQTMATSASHLFHSGRPRSPTCRRSRSLPHCRNTCLRSGRACLRTGLHLNGKEAWHREAVMRFKQGRTVSFATEHLPT